MHHPLFFWSVTAASSLHVTQQNSCTLSLDNAFQLFSHFAIWRKNCIKCELWAWKICHYERILSSKSALEWQRNFANRNKDGWGTRVSALRTFDHCLMKLRWFAVVKCGSIVMFLRYHRWIYCSPQISAEDTLFQAHENAKVYKKSIRTFLEVWSITIEQ